MTCTFGIAHGPLDHSITLHGRDGYLQLTRQGMQAIAPRLFGDTALHDIPLTETDSIAAFGHMWEDYARGILESVPTRQTGEDGKRAVEMVQAAYRSNATGRTIDLPPRSSAHSELLETEYARSAAAETPFDSTNSRPRS
jgi:predicted dehydrogenase